MPGILTIKDKLVSFWKLDSLVDGVFEDIHGTHHLTMANGVTTAAGIKDNAASFDGTADQKLTVANSSQFNGYASDWTLMFWVKPVSGYLLNNIISKMNVPEIIVEYRVFFSGVNEITVEVGNDDGDTLSAVATSTGTWANNWNMVTVIYSKESKLVSIQINEGTSAGTKGSQSAPYPGIGKFASSPFVIGDNGWSGATITGLVDEVAFWRRAVTQAEIKYIVLKTEEGDGFDEWPDLPAEVAAESCPTIECCDDDAIYAYKSANASDAKSGSGLGTCPNLVSVLFDPPSGASVDFPLRVTLTADHPDADIWYNTDGLDPDNTGLSTSIQYTGPITVSGPEVQIIARAFVEGCETYPVFNGSYTVGTTPVEFICGSNTPDKVGQWDDWGANGVDDYQWRLNWTPVSSETVTRLELYLLDSDGRWTTGAAWSTDNPIYPFADDPEKAFEVFPLGVYNQVPTQLNGGVYKSSFGSFGPGLQQWDLFGDRTAATGSFWKLKIFMGDGRILHTIIPNSGCVDLGTPPTPCVNPAAPSLSAQCGGQIDVTVSDTAPFGRDYAVYRALLPPHGDGLSNIAFSGTTAGASTVLNDTGLVKGGTYEYLVGIAYGGTCGTRFSTAVQATTPIDAIISSFTANPSTIAVGQSTLLQWVASAIPSTGACATNQVTIDNGVGDKPMVGTASVSPASTTTYTITPKSGCGHCGSPSRQVTVTIDDAVPPNCNLNLLKLLYTVKEVRDNGTRSTFGPAPGSCGVGSLFPEWNGDIALPVGLCGGTQYDISALTATTSRRQIRATLEWIPLMSWHLIIVCDGNDDFIYWDGHKYSGQNFLGVYTRLPGGLGGIANGPATLTVV